MTARLEAAEPALLAVLSHMVVTARQAVDAAAARQNEAQAAIRRAGLDPAAIDRALQLIEIDPVQMEQEQREAATILSAIGAGVELQDVEVIIRTADEPTETRLARARRTGYLAAILNKPCVSTFEPGSRDHAMFVEGFNAFRSDLRAYTRSQQPKVRRQEACAA